MHYIVDVRISDQSNLDHTLKEGESMTSTSCLLSNTDKTQQNNNNVSTMVWNPTQPVSPYLIWERDLIKCTLTVVQYYL